MFTQGALALVSVAAGLIAAALAWRLMQARRECHRLAVRLDEQRREGDRIRSEAVKNEPARLALAELEHDLRTPLNGVLGFAQLLAKDPGLTPRSRERVALIQACGEGLQRVIGERLERARGSLRARGAGVAGQGPAVKAIDASSEARPPTLAGAEELQALLELARRGEICALRERLGALQDRHARDPRLLQLSQLARDYQMERIRNQLSVFLASRPAA